MRDYFFELADALLRQCHAHEVLLLTLAGEHSDFVRLNQALIRQAGSVTQNLLTLHLIHAQKQATATLDLSGQLSHDLAQAKQLLTQLREQLPHLPDDPFLYYATEIHSSDQVRSAQIPESSAALDEILSKTTGNDLVGIWANGATYSAFANTFGQRNWHSQSSFNFDWSLYHNADKAVKGGYAGDAWDGALFTYKLDQARQQLSALSLPPRTIAPGKYRAYLSPHAVRELLDMMSWGGFGLKSHRAQHTPLLKMVKEGWRLSPKFSLREDHDEGLTPAFTHTGFIKPQGVDLIHEGIYRDTLVSARSAKEFNAPLNADHEHPQSLSLSPGLLDQSEILTTLDTGLYINNLWYCNFSDHNHCRITGMTRFACFWVERGEIVAPINVMRFDDTIYSMFGDQLLALTHERETLLDASSYEHRSATSYRLPGALLEALTLTL